MARKNAFAAKTAKKAATGSPGAENTETALAVFKLPALPGIYASEQERLVTDFEDRYETLAKLKEAKIAAGALKNVIADAVENSFGIVVKPNKEDAVFLGIMGTFTAGSSLLVAAAGLWPLLALTIPVTGVCAGFGRHEMKTKPAAKYQFDQKYRTLLWYSHCLQGDEKKLLADFARAARGVYGLEHAAYIQAQVLEGKKSARHMKKGRAILDDTLKDMGMGRDEAKALREAYNRNAFPAPGKFLETLESACRRIEKAFDEKIMATVTAQPQRTLPPGQNP